MHLSELFKNKKKTFIAYLTAGDPAFEKSLDYAKVLSEQGVDILEIGVPFSDPIADGPTIQNAMQRALSNQVSINQVFDWIKLFKQSHSTPVVMFTYYNPILSMGEIFFKRLEECSVEGLLVLDLPLEENQLLSERLQATNTSLIHVVTPSTSKERFLKIEKASNSFIYYAAFNGCSGMREEMASDYEEKFKQFKSWTDLPVVYGFGLSTKEQVKSVLEYADGVVVGSYFVNAISSEMPQHDFKEHVRKIVP